MNPLSLLGQLFSGGNPIKAIGDAIHENVTSDKERIELSNEAAKAGYDYNLSLAKLEAADNAAQDKVNEVEAANPSLFVAGWRPAVGWICAIGVAYAVILFPIFCWLNGIINTAYHSTTPNPPQIDISILMPVLMGMLGLGYLRTKEKIAGVETVGVGAGKK